MTGRITGPSILLGSGSYFDFAAPEQSAARVTLQDLAWGLAGCNRFAAQTAIYGRRFHYTVAQHCVDMSHAVPRDLAFAALMHECGEAVCGDMTTPLKLLCPDFCEIEHRCDAAIQRAFGVVPADPVMLKHWDLRMLATERRDLMPWAGEAWSWLDGIEPLPQRIVPVSGSLAAAHFLHRFRQLAP